jgi:tetratricopeptide (TPR) repeat protein
MAGGTTQGQLGRYPLPRLLAYLGRKGFTGVMRLTTNPPAEVLFHDGIPVGYAPEPPQPLCRLLLETGRLTPEVFARTMQAVTEGRMTEEEGLRALAGVPDAELLRCRRYQLFQQLVRLFGLRDAAFTLSNEPDERIPWLAASGAAVEPAYLLWHGIRNAYDADRLRQELGATLDQAFTLKPDMTDQIDRLGFKPDERVVSTALSEGYYTLQELRDATGATPQTTLGVVYALLCTEALDLSAPEAVHNLRPHAASAAAAAAAVAAVSFVPAPTPSPAPLPAQVAPAARSTITAKHPTGTQAGPVRTGSFTVQRGRAPSRVESSAESAVSLLVRKARVSLASLREAGTLKPEALDLANDLLERIEQMDGQNAFRLLGVTPDTPADQIKQWYLELVRKFHPDRFASLGLATLAEPADALFRRITEAYQTLSNPTLRDEAAKLFTGDHEAADPLLARRLIGAEMDFQKGEVYLRKGDLAQAEEHFQRAVDGNPEEGEHLALLAWVRYLQAPLHDRPTLITGTKEFLVKAIGLSPRCARAHYFLGKMFEAEKNVERALDCFKRAVDLRPNYIEAMREVRLIEMRRGQDATPKKKSSFFEAISLKNWKK